MSGNLPFFRNWLSKLRHMKWFNTEPVVCQMSVMEHSYMVAAIAYCMALQADSGRQPINYRVLLARALFHDLEEAYTGDVNTLMKRRLSSRWRYEWRDEAERAIKDMVRDMDIYSRATIADAWYGAKSRDLEGKIIEAADLFSMYLYAEEERHMGNTNMEAVRIRIRDEFIAKLPDYDWLWPWKQEIGCAELLSRGVGQVDISNGPGSSGGI